MNPKLAVALINHKGGVGKTTLAAILAEIALEKGKRVVAVDVDPQKNFTDAMSFIQDRYGESLFITGDLEEADRISADGDMIVLDCPPALSEPTARAIDYADITLVPVFPDLFSLSNLYLVYEFGERHEKSLSQLPLVKVGFDKRRLSEMAQTNLEKSEYQIVGEIPMNRLIPYNLTLGRFWSAGIPMPARKPFYDLYKAIYRGYARMLEGNFDHPWEV